MRSGKTPLPWWSLHENSQRNNELISWCLKLQGMKKKFGTKNESFAQNDEETRRGRKLRVSYQSFEGRNLKNACMKFGRRKKNGVLSLPWRTRANDGERRFQVWLFWKNEDIRIKASEKINWTTRMTLA